MSVCVSNVSLCDGVSDCDNSEDEYHCGESRCYGHSGL